MVQFYRCDSFKCICPFSSCVYWVEGQCNFWSFTKAVCVQGAFMTLKFSTLPSRVVDDSLLSYIVKSGL